MIYVSLLEIIVKSQSHFMDAGYSEGYASLYSTLCFFAGMLGMMVNEKIIHYIGGDHDHAVNQKTETVNGIETDQNISVPHCIGSSDDPIAELEEWHKNADEENKKLSENATQGESMVSDTEQKDPESCQSEKDNNDNILTSTKDAEKIDWEAKKLIQMGTSTALAIAIHNFPEGLATFVAALEDPKVGAVLAIALGIHNIPEGLCVALPVYYATGNRMKGFLWGLVSGLTEPIGALIGWLVLANMMSDKVYAALFGLVAGMMTFISIRELIPTAYRYDPKDTVVTYFTIFGMFIMAISLVLFKL